jgi:hypothetical protein
VDRDFLGTTITCSRLRAEADGCGRATAQRGKAWCCPTGNAVGRHLALGLRCAERARRRAPLRCQKPRGPRSNAGTRETRASRQAAVAPRAGERGRRACQFCRQIKALPFHPQPIGDHPVVVTTGTPRGVRRSCPGDSLLTIRIARPWSLVVGVRATPQGPPKRSGAARPLRACRRTVTFPVAA